MNIPSIWQKDNWKTYQLSQICSLRSGNTPYTGKKEYWCQHQENCDCINWYTGKDITKGNLETERKITALALREYKLNLTTRNSILFNYIECSPFFSGKDGVACQGGGGGTHILEPNLNLVVPNFLYYLLLAKQSQLRKLRTGTAQLKIRGGELMNFLIGCPPLPIQHQILTKFQLVYNKIHKTEIVYNDTLLKILQKHLEIGDLLFLKHKDSEIKVGEKFKLVRGKTPATKIKEYWENGTIKWLNNGALTNCFFLTNQTKPSKLISEKAQIECQLQYCYQNSVVLSLVETTVEKMAWNQTEDLVVGCNACNITSENKKQNGTLFFSLRKVNFSNYAGGSVINNLRSSDLLNLKINWVSNPTIQTRLLILLNSPLAKIKDLHSQIKDLLLLKYFG